PRRSGSAPRTAAARTTSIPSITRRRNPQPPELESRWLRAKAKGKRPETNLTLPFVRDRRAAGEPQILPNPKASSSTVENGERWCHGQPGSCQYDRNNGAHTRQIRSRQEVPPGQT